MPSNSFNVGRDAQIIIQHPFAGGGGRLDIAHVEGFTWNQVTANVSVDRLDGRFITAQLPKNWTAEINCARGGANVDTFFDALETAYYNGINIPPGQLFVFITEVDGSVTTYQFDDVSFALSGAGSFKNDAKVDQKISCTASRRRRV